MHVFENLDKTCNEKNKLETNPEKYTGVVSSVNTRINISLRTRLKRSAVRDIIADVVIQLTAYYNQYMERQIESKPQKRLELPPSRLLRRNLKHIALELQ